MSVVVTREHAETIVSLLEYGLSEGVGIPEPGKMCVEALVCYAMGLPHGDNPACVSQPLRRLKIGLNDAEWSSNEARAKGLRRLALAQLGSAGVLDDAEFVRRVVDVTIRRSVPAALRAAASVNPTQADALEAAAVRCEQDGTREACLHAEGVAARAAWAASAESAARAARAESAAWAARAAWAASAESAERAAWAASAESAESAERAARAARAASAESAARAATAERAERAAMAASDASLARYAEWIVEILIDLHAPGCQWLDLVPKDEAA